jgi:hypothetical protein
MDPYLEDPITWPSVQVRFITHISDALNPLLLPRYIAHIQERLVVTEVEPVEGYVEIRPLAQHDHVITVVEVLSPGNKLAGSKNRKRYLNQQDERLQSPTNLIEIDLLRGGEHTIAAPRELLPRGGAWDYLACIRRGGKKSYFEVWPILLRERLPCIPVPLADGDPDVVLNLQELFDQCYDRGGFEITLDYRHAPPIPLSAKDKAWAHALLRKRRLR